MVGVRRGAVLSLFLRAISRDGTRYLQDHRNFITISNKKRSFKYVLLPSEVKLPVKATPGGVGCCDVLECLIRDDIYYGTHNRSTILDDSRQQWLQPALGALAMGIQEGDHFAANMLSAQESGPDQARALLCPKDKRFHRQLGHIVLQLFAQEVYRKII